MIIEYKKDNFVQEIKQMEIGDDIRNVFLKGRNPYDNFETYFGIWTNEKYLIIATLISNRTIHYEYYSNRSVHTESDIKKYLANNNNVTVISKNEFQDKLKGVISIFEM